jgi:hypothetical protein
MQAVSNRFAVRVSAIQRKVTARAGRAGKTSYGDLSARLTQARKQLAQARRGH